MIHHPKKRSLELCALTILMLLSCGQAFAQNGSWETKNSLPATRGGAATAVLNGQLYVATGFTTPGGATTAVQAYDPATDTWSSKAPIPTARSYAGAAAIGGKLYVVGGGTANSDCPI